MRLHVFQSMWGMQRLPGEKAEWSLERAVDEIAAAGFDGAGVDFSQPVDVTRRTTSLLEERGLRWWAGTTANTVGALEKTISLVEELGAAHCDHINLQPDVRLRTVEECVPYVLGWRRLAEDAGIDLYLETHRDRMTNDLLFTVQLLEAIDGLELTADLSHYLVAREFRWPVTEESHGLIRLILERSVAFHGRVGTREQIQVQFGFPHQRQWLDLFLAWWETGFRLWRDRAVDDATLVFTPELGPPEWYAMTDADGREMSDRWEEAKELKRLARELWARLDAEELA